MTLLIIHFRVQLGLVLLLVRVWPVIVRAIVSAIRLYMYK